MADTAQLLNYTRVFQDSSAETLEYYTDFFLESGKSVGNIYMNFDDSAVAQVEQVTITNVAGADAYYSVKIAGATETVQYDFLALTADTHTTATIAAALAKLINSHADVVASATGAVVTITGVVPGAAFTSTVDCRNKADDLQVSPALNTATSTAASGTPRTSQLFKFAMQVVISQNFPNLQIEVTSYDQDENPTGQVRTLTAGNPTNMNDLVYVAP